MNSYFKMILAGLGTSVGLAVMIFIGIFAYQIKGELHDSRVAAATADSVKWTGLIDGLQGRLSLLDQNAATTKTTFVKARIASAVPIITGGGVKADSIANTAIQACFAKATAALTACEVARKTADSLPAMKDSLTAARVKLASLSNPGRWTAKGFLGFAYPIRQPMLGISTDFRLPLVSLNLTAGADYVIGKNLSNDAWRAYVGASIPLH